MPEDLPERFEEATGVPVTVANHATNEEIVTKLTAGGDSGIDVAFVSGQFAQALGEFGCLAPLDHAQIPNLANLYPEATELAYDPGNAVSVPYAWGTTGLCYRSDLIDAPTSWNDLLEPAEDVAGKTTMLATERWLMLPAQKALGLLGQHDRRGRDGSRSRTLLTATKDTLLAYDDTTFYSRLVSGEAVARRGLGRLVQLRHRRETPTSSSWCPRRAATSGPTRWSCSSPPRTRRPRTPSSTTSCDPEIHAWVVENILYKVPNQAAMELIDPGLIEAFPNLGMTPAELLRRASSSSTSVRRLRMYTQIATEIAAQ